MALLTSTVLSMPCTAALADGELASSSRATTRVTLIKTGRPVLLLSSETTGTAFDRELASTELEALELSLVGGSALQVHLLRSSLDATGATLPDGETRLRIVLRSE